MELFGIFFSADITTAMPILICALGLVVSERAGVLNIGAEGTMLVGALFGIVGTYYFGNVWLGILLGAFVGFAYTAIFAFLTITLRANQVVVGMGMNMFALGFTTTLHRSIFQGKGFVLLDKLEKITMFDNLGEGIFGNLLSLIFGQDLIVYFAFIMVFVIHHIMFETEIGLKIRAVGEYPKACASVGVDVIKTRYKAVLFSGVMMGLAGAYLSAGQVSIFAENMVQGRGFMAVAVVVLARYTPIGVMFASLVFAAGTAFSYILIGKGIDLPHHFFIAIPYIITIVALVISVGDYKGPKSTGIPYEKSA